ncbi:MAG: CDP-alcohol phosphatidyltransferase family protein [Candidatus Promineifilaceae bacterium]
MLDRYMRGVKEAVLRPIFILLKDYHPLWFTLFGLLFGIATAFAAYTQFYWLAFLFWVISRIFDAIDGGVARYANRQSDLGGYLDIVIDHIVYAIIPIGIVLGAPSNFGYTMLALLLTTFYVNGASWMYLSAILEKRAAGAATRGEQTSVTMPEGLIGGSETIIFYSAFVLFANWYPWLFAAMGFLVVITIIQRIPWAVRELQ